MAHFPIHLKHYLSKRDQLVSACGLACLLLLSSMLCTRYGPNSSVFAFNLRWPISVIAECRHCSPTAVMNSAQVGPAWAETTDACFYCNLVSRLNRNQLLVVKFSISETFQSAKLYLTVTSSFNQAHSNTFQLETTLTSATNDKDYIRIAYMSPSLEREPRTVIHVKRAKMFDPMGWFEVPPVFRKCFAGRLGVGLSPQNHPLKSEKNRGKKIGFYSCKKGQG